MWFLCIGVFVVSMDRYVCGFVRRYICSFCV